MRSRGHGRLGAPSRAASISKGSRRAARSRRRRAHAQPRQSAGNVCTPSYLGKTAQDLAKSYKSLRVKVLGLPEIKREKMGCFLAVTQGSEEPPGSSSSSIAIRGPKAPRWCWSARASRSTPAASRSKTPPLMDEMKFDMSGAACVIGTMKAVAELNLPVNVVGLVAACENMPDGRAIKPGDIVTSAAGLTVEISTPTPKAA
jgi:leucyl aminopeptidase